MSNLLTGKVVVVTGGASGIGRGICIAAAKQGAKLVIVGDLNAEPREGGEPVETAVKNHGCQFIFRCSDVSSKSDIEALLQEAEKHGGVDLMACNAGIAMPADTIDINEQDYRKLVSVNQDGAFFTAQAAGQQMRRLGKTGSIVFTSSMGGLRGASMTVVYCATKAALTLLAASMADSLGPHGIRVNAICPGLINTSLSSTSPEVSEAIEIMSRKVPLRRVGQPEEVGNVVVWLGSDMASYINGASIPIDGGLSSIL